LRWTHDSNNDPAAFEALADMLEVHGDIEDDASPTASALSALRRAAVLSTDPTQQLRIKSNEAWVRFKRGEFAEAKRLADDLLVPRPIPAANDAQVLIGLCCPDRSRQSGGRSGKRYWRRVANSIERRSQTS